MEMITLPRCTQCRGDLLLVNDVFRCGNCGKPCDTIDVAELRRKLRDGERQARAEMSQVHPAW